MTTTPDLATWWVEHATSEADATAHKAAIYGSHDLVEIGRTMAHIAGHQPQNDIHAMEIGIMFYALGKIHRIIAAHTRNQPAQTDSWFDLAVYAKMVLAARAGAWPLNPNTQKDTE